METPPTAGDWIYELKFDGIRAIAIKNGGKVSLMSRNKNELRARFPEIAEAIKKLPIQECVIDGEIVALDEEGRSSFQLLQAQEMEEQKAPICFYVFDLLQLEGRSLIKLPSCATQGNPEPGFAPAPEIPFGFPGKSVRMRQSYWRK